MQNLNFRSSLAILIYNLLFIAFFIPGLSHAYGGRHYGYSGYGHYGHSKYYGYHRYGRHSYYPRRYYGGGHSYSNYPRKYYRHQYYDSRSRDYEKHPKSYSYSTPVYTQINGNQAASTIVQNNGINSPAWQTLTHGQYDKALGVFAQEAQSHPNSGIPKVGYALATASRGELERGVWAMRRAFKIDPDSLHYLQLDEKGHVAIESLITQYSSQENNANGDQVFMVSALHYLKHDYATAKQTITSAEQNRDNSSSYTNLQQLIDQQLKDQVN